MTEFLYGITAGIEQCGRYVPSADIVSGYVTGLVWWLMLAVITVAVPLKWAQKRLLLIGWGMKLLVCMLLMLPYERSYSVLDAFTYYGMARTFSFDQVSLGIGLGYYAPVAVTHAFLLIVGDSFHAIKLLYAYVGLLGTLFVAHAASDFSGARVDRCFYVLLCFPSLLFWSSILGKDPLILFGIGVCLYGTAKWWKLNRVRFLLYALVGITVVSAVRVWTGLLLLSLLALMVTLSSGRCRSFVSTRRLCACVGLLVAAFAIFLATGQLNRLDSAYNDVDTKWEHRDSTVDVSIDRSSAAGILRFAPLGIAIALYAPFPIPGMVHNAFSALASAETTALLFISIYIVANCKRHDLRRPVVLWAALVVLAWGTLYAFVSYKDLGAAVRYRTQIMPWFVIGLISVQERRQLHRKRGHMPLLLCRRAEPSHPNSLGGVACMRQCAQAMPLMAE